MNTRSCVHKFRDEGCLNSTSLAASRDGQYLACGWVCILITGQILYDLFCVLFETKFHFGEPRTQRNLPGSKT